MDFTKYNTLGEFHHFLHLARSLAPSTANTYLDAIDFLLNDQTLIDCTKLDIDMVMAKLKKIKHKQQYSKYKSAFLYFCEFLNIELDDKIISELEAFNEGKTKKRRNLKSKNLTDIKNHIKPIKDKKLKLSYEVMIASGLRIFELTQIEKENCIVSDDTIEFSFIGKGQRLETVNISKKETRKLYEDLVVLIDKTPDGKKVFYSKDFLQKKAKEKGFACHDLRRAYAKTEYQKDKDIQRVMELMRHQSQKTTKVYLDSKIDI